LLVYMVEVDRNAPGLRPNSHLRSWTPHLLSSCRNLGLWLPELCSEVLKTETVSATDLASPSLTTYLYYDYKYV